MFMFLFLLSAFVSGWISASVSQYQTVEALPGEEVTLQYNNISKHDSQTFWSRLVNITKINCVVVMFRYRSRLKICDGYEKGKFEMKSNISSVFLNIKKVDSSDSGLYYCGFLIEGTPSLTPIHLKVNGESDGIAMLTSVILGALTVVLVLVIIGLVVENRKLQTAVKEDQNPERRGENLLSDQLKDAALSCYPTPVRSRRPASEREVETRVIYTASRQTQRGSGFN
uniref:Immunoglobulin V-set domain-containing protein n=1 Tax=Sparus aurata TaxID=8175 RepID=A0A671XX51_SPAAU